MGLNLLLVGLASYFLGAIPIGAIISRLWPDAEADILDEEAADIGSLDVWQKVGSIPAAVSFILNVLKGALVVWVSQRFGLTDWVLPIAGTLAVIGYCWSPFLRFGGGMGIGVTVGEMFLSMPFVVLTFALTWLGWALAFRHRERAVGATAMVGPVIVWLLGYPPPELALILLLGTVLFVRHASGFSLTHERFWIG